MVRASSLTLLTLGLLSSAARGDDRPNTVVAIADDWSYPHAGVYGDKVIKTTHFNRYPYVGAATK